MTNDLAFSRIRGYLIPGSYQYEVAQKYATGVDITFTSRHTLDDPAFTGNTVTNFVWITEDCFSVDISFVKHMRLWYGTPVDDAMNDRSTLSGTTTQRTARTIPPGSWSA